MSRQTIRCKSRERDFRLRCRHIKRTVGRSTSGPSRRLGFAIAAISDAGKNLPFALALAFATPLAAQEFGDAARGQQIFAKCKSCHQIGAGATDRTGPHLNGLFGRRAGAHEGFRYSDDMQMMGADGLTWQLETLDAYLENPKSIVSRTRMNFTGLKDPTDRADILAYLRAFSDNPRDIPEASPTATPQELQLAPEVLALQGDLAYGEYLSAECTTCHQTSGLDEGIPSIVGWLAEDFVIAMHAYRRQLRPHPVMQMMAGRLSNEEIAALAAYFGTLD